MANYTANLYVTALPSVLSFSSNHRCMYSSVNVQYMCVWIIAVNFLITGIFSPELVLMQICGIYLIES